MRESLQETNGSALIATHRVKVKEGLTLFFATFQISLPDQATKQFVSIDDAADTASPMARGAQKFPTRTYDFNLFCQAVCDAAAVAHKDLHPLRHNPTSADQKCSGTWEVVSPYSAAKVGTDYL